MFSPSISPQLAHYVQIPSAKISLQERFSHLPHHQSKSQQIGRLVRKPKHVISENTPLNLFLATVSAPILFQTSVVPLAASVAILLWPGPAQAGFLSGSSGLESVPGPELPKIEFLNRFNEENQKRYAELDARFKESPLLKQLLEKSKQNKEKNKQEILDKYCIRGAEWGVGDCSAEGMTPDEREKFIAMLKQKAGIKE